MYDKARDLAPDSAYIYIWRWEGDDEGGIERVLG